MEFKECISNVEASLCISQPKYRHKYLCLTKRWDAPRLIVAEAQKKGISAHDALKQAGFIRNPIDDFINVG